MAIQLRYAVRRAKNRAERAQGKRWIAQAEFPGGRKIVYDRTRNRAPAVQKLEQVVRAEIQQIVTQTGGGGGGGGGGGSGSGGGGRYPIVRLE